MCKENRSILIIYWILFTLIARNRIECRSSGGHYSSQRSLGTGGPTGGYGMSTGSQSPNSINSLFPFDMNSWYEYGTSMTLHLFSLESIDSVFQRKKNPMFVLFGFSLLVKRRKHCSDEHSFP